MQPILTLLFWLYADLGKSTYISTDLLLIGPPLCPVQLILPAQPTFSYLRQMHSAQVSYINKG